MPCPATPTAALRVLLVEDDEVFADYLTSLLTRGGLDARVDHAGSIADALARLAVQPYDAVLLDLRLPNGAGLDTIRRVLSAPSVPPPIVLTGGDEVDEAAALRAGAQDFLPKSVLAQMGVARAGEVLARTVVRAVHRDYGRAHVLLANLTRGSNGG